MKRLIVAVIALLCLPAAASAAPLNELPFQPLPERRAAGCLHATGAPGGLAQLGPYSRRRSATDLLTVTGDGAAARERVEMGRLYECAAIAEAPGGAAVHAATVVTGQYDGTLRAVVRDPGGAFGPPLTLADTFASPEVAVGPAGHAVVTWIEAGSNGRYVRVMAARRAPGGGFGTRETVGRFRSDIYGDVELLAGMDGAGNATLLWARELPTKEPGYSGRRHLEAATAAPGAAFAVHRLASNLSSSVRPALAVAADGWTLAAHQGEDEGVPAVLERAPGGAFTAVRMPPPPDDPSRTYRTGAAIAVRDGGGAVVAWRAGTFDSSGGLEAVTRRSAGAFTSAVSVAPTPAGRYYGSSDFSIDVGFSNLLDPFSGPPLGDDAGLHAALAADGRVLLGWTSETGERPLATRVTRVAAGRLGEPFERPQTLGAPQRTATDLAPLFLPDGRAAVAWTDNAGGLVHGRLHVAVEGAPALPAAAAPRLTLRAPRRQRLFASQPLRVTARCDAACDLRATVLGPHGPNGAHTSTRLHDGAARLDAGAVDDIRPGTPRTVRVVVRASAPGGGRTTERSLRVLVERRPPLPVRLPLGVRAHRKGDAIVVRWRTRKPARRQYFLVAGQRRRTDPDTTEAVGYRAGRGRTRFSIRLRPQRPERVRWVTIYTAGSDGNEQGDAVRRARVAR